MTIVELLVSMTVFSLIMIAVVASLQAMGVTRLQSVNRVTLIEQLYFFSEQLFSEIKDGGTIDYEEYWNRYALENGGISWIWSGSNGGWYYVEPSWVGNYGSGWLAGDLNNYGDNNGPYYCRSEGGSSMGTGWCLLNFNTTWTSQVLQPQRYGQYALQFWDYNGNKNDDTTNLWSCGSSTPLWDENCDGNIVGDEDDYSILDGPVVFSWAIPELYLIDKNKNPLTRTYFRWVIKKDPNNLGATCNVNVSSTGVTTTGTGCLGNIEMLKLDGADMGWSHSGASATGAFDWVADTWFCHPGWVCAWKEIDGRNLATGTGTEWIPLFPKSINVKNLRFDLFPKKDPWLAVAAPDCTSDPTCVSPFIHPYVRVTLEIGFSYEKRKLLKNFDPSITISTTISLDDFR